MKKGKIPYNSLIRSVLRVPFPQKETGAVSQDGALLSADGTAAALNTTVYGGPGAEKFAFYRAFNSALAAGISPVCLQLSITAPVRERESRMLQRMQAFQEASEGEKVHISGGHTAYSENTAVPVLTCVISGKKQITEETAAEGCAGMHRRPEAGDALIFTKFTGDAGAAILYREKQAELEKHFAPEFLSRIPEAEGYLSCAKEAEIFRETGAVMHDVSEGGILGALWEFAEGHRIGFSVDELSVPIHQETVEICEFLGGNPYTLLSTGCMLAAVKDGEAVMEKLHEAGIPAVIIGRVESGVKKLLIRRDEVHYLDRPQPDFILSLESYG